MSADEDTIEKRIDTLDKHKQSEGEYAVHLVGLGSTGIGLSKAVLESDGARDLIDRGGELSVWAVDIANPELDEVEEMGEELIADVGGDAVSVTTRSIETPEREALYDTLRSYREYLKKEYPAYYWQPNYDPWIPADVELDVEPMRRGVAKAIYGHHYYNTEVLKDDMRAFADQVEETENPSQVYIGFGLGGGTGSGIVPDFARHLSHVSLGRKTPVTAISVLPCDGDREEYKGGNPYIAINDVDALVEHEANDGVVDVWGELYRNPFNNGVMMVSQEPAWQETNDIHETHEIVDDAIAELITGEGGRTGWNTIRVATLLANIDNPPESWPPRSLPTQDIRWVNLLVPLANAGDIDLATADLEPDARTLFTEFQVMDGDESAISDDIESAFADHAQNVSVTSSAIETDSAAAAAIGFVPRLSKVDLEAFHRCQDAYEEMAERDKVLDHSFLMELGVMLNEPSVRFEGVAGECIWGCACWVGVPMERVRGTNLEAELELPDTSGPPHAHAHDHEHDHEHAHDD